MALYSLFLSNYQMKKTFILIKPFLIVQDLSSYLIINGCHLTVLILSLYSLLIYSSLIPFLSILSILIIQPSLIPIQLSMVIIIIIQHSLIPFQLCMIIIINLFVMIIVNNDYLDVIMVR